MAQVNDLVVNGIARFNSTVYLGTVHASAVTVTSGTLTGTATYATYATYDSQSNSISGTYIKKSEGITDISISGTTLTYTKGNGTTGTVSITSAITVENVLTSNSTTNALSANMGYTLQQNKWSCNGTRSFTLDSGSSSTAYMLGRGSATTSSGYVMLDNLVPYSNNNYQIGTSNWKFANMYATTFHGALDGNATTATSATNDSDGNAINTTYVKKTEGITGLSISGTTLTYTRGDNTTGTITLSGGGSFTLSVNNRTLVDIGSSNYRYTGRVKFGEFNGTALNIDEYSNAFNSTVTYNITNLKSEYVMILLGVFDLDYDFSRVLHRR